MILDTRIHNKVMNSILLPICVSTWQINILEFNFTQVNQQHMYMIEDRKKYCL